MHLVIWWLGMTNEHLLMNIVWIYLDFGRKYIDGVKYYF